MLSLSVGLEDKVIFILFFLAEMLQQLFLTSQDFAAGRWSWSRWLLEALLCRRLWGQEGVNLSVNLGRSIFCA